MRTRTFNLVAGSSLLTLACAAGAQTEPSAFGLEEIVVTARRRAESLQDVPQTVNAVTAEAIDKLNIQRFDEIQALVPGLTMSAGNTGYTTAATIRGASYQVESGASPTVEFYLNDAIIGSNFLFQSMYDVGQIEVLRGPQGTLRGRASPSGSITATTRLPDLTEFGGYANVTATDQEALNGHAAINLPIVNEKLALRVAGLYDENEYDQVRSINNPGDPSSETKSGRVTLLFEPNDALRTSLMYQYLRRDIRSFDQYQSFYLAEPTAPVVNTSTYPEIKASDRLGITDFMRDATQKQDVITGLVDYRFAGQKLSYVGSFTKQDIPARSPQDVGNVALNFDFYQELLTQAEQKTHELRLASEERVFGVFDYTLGAYYLTNPNSSDIVSRSLVGIQSGQYTVQPVSVPAAGAPGGILPTIITRSGLQEETSFFGNLTYHLGERTELSGGLRSIDFKNRSTFVLGGAAVPTAAENDKETPIVYNVSVSHRFTDDFLVYANHGKSWRNGPLAVGVFRAPTPRLSQFTDLRSETSKSYEVGFKTDLLDDRLRVNASVFRQDFSNYLYRGPSVYYVNISQGRPVPSTFNFVANVDAKVDGAELEIGFQPTENLSLNASFSYAKGDIDNGLIACNDFDGDGVPDSNPPQPTDANQIRAAAGGEEVAACRVSDRLSFAPDWSGTLQAEYGLPLTSAMDAFARTLLTYNPSNRQDPNNPYDNVDAYGLLNLYLGVQSVDGAWEVALFGKNITDTGEQLNAGNGPLATGYLALPAFSGTTLAGPYMGNVRYTAPREFGINVRYAFGSR